MGDLYFDERYGKLYEGVENGVCEVFDFAHELGTVRHLFIKREIPLLLGARRYYDLVTPYGYGGPVMECEAGHREELAAAFALAFSDYCKTQSVVSEFIRFQPVLGNAEDFRTIYDVHYLRETVATAIAGYEDPVQAEFTSSARKNIRKALRDGVEYRVTLGPDSLQDFQKVYFATMDRNHADRFYYFDARYFDELLAAFGERLLLVEAFFRGEVIGMELHFVYGDLLHTHLSGTYERFHHLSPVYVMQYATVLWAKENGIRLIHGGGGRSNSPEDSLLRFKQQFARTTRFSFHSGQKVWNEAVYSELCQEAGVYLEEEYFPAYRKQQAKVASEV